MSQSFEAGFVVGQEISNGLYVARQLEDDMSWGVGSIQPLPEYANPAAQQELIYAVLDNITKISAEEQPYSSCTDGRVPDALASGEPVPVREQIVGADIVTSLYIADALGGHFYEDPNAPAPVRVGVVADFLRGNRINPSSHIDCGAGRGYTAILEQNQRFARNPQYVGRLGALLLGKFDPELHQRIVAGNAQRLQRGAYDGLSLDTFLGVVEERSGKRAIAKLKDDGRGVHGHVEEAIVRVKIDGYAIDEAGVARATNGREVFGVNDLRMEKLADLFAQGDEQAYRTALIAAEDFASSGHGTLAKGLPTWVVTKA